MPHRFFILIAAVLLCAAAASAAPPDLTAVAMLVAEEPTADLDLVLDRALQSEDARVRAVAARVATVRSRTALLPRIESALTGETDAEAARELVRALVILGGAQKLDAAIAVSERFEHRLDTAVAIATARLGAETALAAYDGPLKRLTAYPKPAFFRVAFWGAVRLVPKTAQALLAAGDEHGWRALVEAMNESDYVLDARSLAAALQHPSEDIRRATIAALIEDYSPKYPFAESVAAVLRDSVAPAYEPAAIAFDRELLRRIAGAAPSEGSEWLEWLGNEAVATALERRRELLELLTKKERAALSPARKKLKTHQLLGVRTDVAPPPFYTPDVLPAGAAEAILAATGCRGGWLGLGEVKVDRAGRVLAADLSSVQADATCRKAAAAMTTLALVHPTSIGSPFETKAAIFVRSASAPLCLDEAPVPAASEENIEACSLSVIGEGSACKPPVVVTRTDLRILPQGSGSVVLEALVTETGCVRSARLVSQSQSPQLNGAALLSLLGWRFEPATRAGVPIPTLFRLTINVRR